MRGIACVLKKELETYLFSPLIPLFAGLFLLSSGYLTTANLLYTRIPKMAVPLHNMAILFLFLIPILTMRLFAEERQTGTLELVLATPLHDHAIILGKYLASLTIFTAILILTSISLVPLYLLASPETGPIVSGYLYLFLLGVGSLALGVLASALTRSQLIAAALSYFLLLFFWFADTLPFFPHSSLAGLLTFLSFSVREVDFLIGIVDLSSFIYYPSIAAGALALSGVALKMIRLGL